MAQPTMAAVAGLKETYTQLKSFDTPIKLENITLLGEPAK